MRPAALAPHAPTHAFIPSARTTPTTRASPRTCPRPRPRAHTPRGESGAGWGCAKSAGAQPRPGTGPRAPVSAVSEIAPMPLPVALTPWVKLTPSPSSVAPSVHLVWHPALTSRPASSLLAPGATPASPCCSSSRCRPCPRLTRARPCRRPWCRSSAHSVFLPRRLIPCRSFRLLSVFRRFFHLLLRRFSAVGSERQGSARATQGEHARARRARVQRSF